MKRQQPSSGDDVATQADVLIDFGRMTAERLGEVYGEVFSKLVRDSVGDFISRRVGAQAPKLNTLAEAANYAKENAEKYPMAHCAFWYGIGKAENLLQGSAGAATRLYLREIVERMTQLDGVGEIIGKIDNTTAALDQFKKVATTMEMLDEGSYQCKGDENAAEVRVLNCPNGDGCKQMLAEGILRTGTRKPLCTIGLGSAVTAELVTATPHDYEIIELDPPNCLSRIFRV